jgi:hypothetical protein
MLALSSLVVFLAATSPSSPVTSASSSSQTTWEKIFDGGAGQRVYAVQALGRDNWVAGGSWGVATAAKDGSKVERTPDRAVLGLIVDGPSSMYALGQGELIWHYDGRKWSEEHVGPVLPKWRGRGERGADLLDFAYYEDASTNAPLVALGPWLVLVRQAGGTWAKPAEADRQKLLRLGQSGPAQFVGRPAKCDALAWRWLKKDLAMFFCDDHRAFIYDAGTVTARGKMPRQCATVIVSVEYVRGQIYASCHSATLWKTEGQTWHQIAAPKGKGLVEIPSIAVADGCLFVAGDRAVWRSCGL